MGTTEFIEIYNFGFFVVKELFHEFYTIYTKAITLIDAPV